MGFRINRSVDARVPSDHRHRESRVLRATLSEREIEVLTRVADGNSNKDIAAKLYISEATVKTHLVHIFGKLGVDDRTAAVTVALEQGIIRLSG